MMFYMRDFTFKDTYSENLNWQNYFTEEGISSILRSSYSKYYDQQGNIRMDSLKVGIINAEYKAKELFKNLFKMPFKVKDGCLEKIISSEVMENIQSEHGKAILAHGVEEAKGGLHNILMMLISNKIYIPAQYWGSLQNGMPNISSLNHGPYYLIYKSPLSDDFSMPTKNLDFNKIERILVPFKEIVDEISIKSEKLLSLELIDEVQRVQFLSKIATFNQFKEELDIQHNFKCMPTKSKKIKLS